ncbi:pyridoxamine 5'-phosphate oxidase [Mycobacterium sp. MS1601]|uniref:pyridoxamine 5'-phosphate oxidase family protein n=1 Tax=Mycobacterium sp. MS1601 TaxID=1936029 RepID=UPI0009793844|nr:pyridoxamine 5'-phosphate oxidase family protein [Mycobacterium sp. MS1601]AQA06374.1 pyridoxamine 5'-phosphate oxidase [Mycobacterium sp. MS1601]
MSTTLSTQDLELLRRPLYGFLTVAGGPQPPQPRPVWFEAADDGTVQLFTGPDTAKVRLLQKDSRASLVVSAPVGEREHWVSVAGAVTLEHDGADELLHRLAARYWDLAVPGRAADLAEMSTQNWLRLVIQPEKVSSYAM